MKETNVNAVTVENSGIHLSEVALREEALNKENARIYLVKCRGCGDEPDTDTAKGHNEKTLVKKSEFKRIQNGKFLARCPACDIEFKNRHKNSKTLVEFRRSIKEIDNMLSKPESYELKPDQITTLEEERRFCFGEIRKALGSDEKVENFLKE